MPKKGRESWEMEEGEEREKREAWRSREVRWFQSQ